MSPECSLLANGVELALVCAAVSSHGCTAGCPKIGDSNTLKYNDDQPAIAVESSPPTRGATFGFTWKIIQNVSVRPESL